eukprot:GILK01005378.1.p1 GENE.GILK01005378.1~~GILK01005378.1.p1  ORF type:complete len:776 (-),score=169.28 GILK01005378.1:97-2331(-)
MTAVIRFTPILGTSGDSPFCYLLQIDECTLLLDCGWTENFNVADLASLEPLIPQIDAVLVSHPDILHLGALPYVVGKLGLKAPVYATFPAYKMGQMFLYDAVDARKRSEDFTTFSLDDVDTAFDRFIQLRYSQHMRLPGKGAGITITPFAAGHMVGGAIWRIAYETELVYYAVSYNHKRERHLNDTVLKTLPRPTVMITNLAKSRQTAPSKRDTELYDIIVKTLRANGNVLMPVDAAGRSLELLMSLESYWQTQKLGTYKIVFMHSVSYHTIEFAKAQIEWMSDSILKTFETTRENPFMFRNIALCHSLEELDRIPGPKVVLTTSPSMDYGFSRELFLRWAEDSKNTVLITSNNSANSLSEHLLTKPRAVKLEVRYKVPLEGADLRAYLEQQRETREREREKEREQERERAQSDVEMKAEPDMLQVPSMEESDSEDEDEEYQDAAPKRFTRGRFKMFAFPEKKVQWDAYGEVLREEEVSFWRSEYKKAIGETVPANVVAVEEQSSKQEPEDAAMPMKAVTEERRVTVNCSIEFIDMQGLSDDRSIRKIVSHIQPRKLILIHGSEDAAASFKTMARNVFFPKPGESVDMTADSHIHKVKVSDPLYSSLDFVDVDNFEIAYLTATTVLPSQEDNDVTPVADTFRTGTVAKSLPVLDMIKADLMVTDEPDDLAHAHDSVMLGDVKLSDFKEFLTLKGFKAEFLASGGLVVNDLVVLKKVGREVSLEGALSMDYYRIRDLLYQQFIIL